MQLFSVLAQEKKNQRSPADRKRPYRTMQIVPFPGGYLLAVLSVTLVLFVRVAVYECALGLVRVAADALVHVTVREVPHLVHAISLGPAHVVGRVPAGLVVCGALRGAVCVVVGVLVRDVVRVTFYAVFHSLPGAFRGPVRVAARGPVDVTVFALVRAAACALVHV